MRKARQCPQAPGRAEAWRGAGPGPGQAFPNPASDSRPFRTLAPVAAAARHQTPDAAPPTPPTTWPRLLAPPVAPAATPPIWTRLWSRPWEPHLFRLQHLPRQNQQASGCRCSTSYCSPRHCCRHARRPPPRGRGSQLRGKYYHRPHPFPRLSGRLVSGHLVALP